MATGVLVFECLLNSASKSLVQRARFATLFAIYTLHRAAVTNQFAVAHCNIEQLVLPPSASFVAVNRALCLAERVRGLDQKRFGCDERGFVTIKGIALTAPLANRSFIDADPRARRALPWTVLMLKAEDPRATNALEGAQVRLEAKK